MCGACVDEVMDALLVLFDEVPVEALQGFLDALMDSREDNARMKMHDPWRVIR